MLVPADSTALARPIIDPMPSDAAVACRDADTIVYPPLGMAGFHIAERLRVPAVLASLVPLTGTTAFPAIRRLSNHPAIDVIAVLHADIARAEGSNVGGTNKLGRRHGGQERGETGGRSFPHTRVVPYALHSSRFAVPLDMESRPSGVPLVHAAGTGRALQCVTRLATGPARPLVTAQALRERVRAERPSGPCRARFVAASPRR